MEELGKMIYGEWLDWFDIGKIEKIEIGKDKDGEAEYEVRIEFREKRERAPRKNLVQKGFYNSLELIDHPMGGMSTYLKFYRRRWKDPQSGEEFGNPYDLRFPGTKLTQSFAVFLKEEDRKGKINEFFDFYPYLRNLLKEDLRMVQESSLGVRKLWYKRIFNGS